jgi:hypothetical protein
MFTLVAIGKHSGAEMVDFAENPNVALEKLKVIQKNYRDHVIVAREDATSTPFDKNDLEQYIKRHVA